MIGYKHVETRINDFHKVTQIAHYTWEEYL